MNFPILSSLILLPLVGSIFIFLSKSSDDSENKNIKYVAYFTSFLNFLISLYLWFMFDKSTDLFQFVETRPWLEGFINYKVGVDGISILFIILTTLITFLCILSVSSTVKIKLKEYLLAILIMESFMIGVFCSLDLVIFYLFFEAGLIPMFLIIGIFLWKVIDLKTIDRFGPDGISNFIKFLSNKAIKFQSGYIYHYAFVMLIGVSILLTYLMVY